MQRTWTRSAIVALTTAAAFVGGAHGQEAWPNGPVTVIVPYDPGGTTDNMVRVIATKMEEALGEQVVVTNTSGGGGVVGMSEALRAKPDGQTVGLYLSNTLVAMGTGAAPFTSEDIQPACMFGDAALTITGTGGDAALPNLAALLDTEDASFAIERGTLSQFAGLLINEASGKDIKLVNVGGGPEKSAAVMGGHITALITPTAGVIQQHEAGQLKILAVLADERLAVAPNLPTAKEQGLDVSFAQSNGFMFPAGTPEAAVTGFCDALEAVAADPEFITRMADINVDVRYMRGDEYATYMSNLTGTITDLAASVGYGG